MKLVTKVQPINRDIQLLLDDVKGGPTRSQILADFARKEIDDASAINQQAIGYKPQVNIFVDGQLGAPLESVRPGGIIVADFVLSDQVLAWIYANLVRFSPVGPDAGGHYYEQHLLYADGSQVDPRGRIPPAEEYIFVNAMPYARKIEQGSSSKAPNGVYQTVATLAQRQFRNIAKITFSYRTVIGNQITGGRVGNRASQRNPAIIVRPK